jgi:hypothetical protein
MTSAKIVVVLGKQCNERIGHPGSGAMRSRAAGGLHSVLRGQPERNQP